jgi:alkyl sulfatase BDS1-like metallo-beta-lactamase superfamily hydrolase
VIKAADGRVIYDADVYTAATAGDCPDTVDPSLWRQSQLNAIQGLFEVTEGIYQLRGIELSNMTIVEGDTGVIVIDPAVSAEVSAAGLAHYREQRCDRPVRAVIFTHSHIDPFGGVLGVVDADTAVPIVAPTGFLDHAVSENVYAGTAMLRRGMYHTGMVLPVNATGTLGVGLGPGTSMGTVGLIAPTLDITHTGQEEIFDGVRIVFQITPATEAPAEMKFYFPQRRALCLAENVTHNLHNLLTLRGAEVCDARGWSRYVNGDPRFAAELASHAVFADPAHAGAKTLLGEVFTRLGYGSECGTWRNNFLTGAQELHGPVTPIGINAAGMATALTITQLFDSLAIRIDGKRAWDTTGSIRWHFTDTGDTYRMELSHVVLSHHPTSRTKDADLVITLTKPQLLGMLGGAGPNGVQFDGDPKVFAMIAGLTDQPDPNFTIVTP